MKFHGSFGGPQTLITSVTIKCNDFGEPDIVSISLIVGFTEPRLLQFFTGYTQTGNHLTITIEYNLFVLFLDARYICVPVVIDHV